MWFNWLADWKQSGRIISTKRRANRRLRRRSARVSSQAEVLEDRTMLTQFIVTTLDDEDDFGASNPATDVTRAGGVGDLSLREAIRLANETTGGPGGEGAGDDQGEADGDTITFHPSLAGGTITLVFDELVITDDLEIDGADQNLANGDAGRITINGNALSRIFQIETTGVAAGSEFSVLLSNLIVTNGRAVGGNGGGILITAGENVSLTNMDITNNTASSIGGGIVNSGTLNVTDSTLSGNSAAFGGGIFNDGTLNVTDSTLSGNSTNSGGGLMNTGMANVTNSTVSGNSAYGGGGISNYDTLNVTNSTLSGNSAEFGGGIANYSGASLSVTNSTLSGNSAAFGGGIFNYGTVNVTNSTVSGNSAEFGGGIFNGRGTANVTNSTISGNSAQLGGGILNGGFYGSGTANVTNSTISGNSAVNGGGIHNALSSTATIRNSIITGNIAGTAPDVQGIFTSNFHNVIGNTTGSSGFDMAEGDDIGTPPNQVIDLTLRDNGGPTLTHALVENSPAIDAGENDDAEGNTDQRDEPYVRIFGDHVDIGAFELQPVNILVTAPGAGIPGIVQVFNADTHELLFSFEPYPGFMGGVRVAVGDVNGDLTPDIITGAGPGGGPHIKVIDGRDGTTELHSFFAFASTYLGGTFVAAADLGVDGKADIIVGADAGGGPHVRSFSGVNASEVHSFFAYDLSVSGGVRVAAGDVDGDGRADIITGAGPGGGPHVKVFDGTNIGDEIASFFAYDLSVLGGVFVAAGDVDGDGVIDVITGAGSGAGPHVKVFSVSDGGAELLDGPIGSFFAYDLSVSGGVRVAATDITGDGRADIFTTPGPGGGPHLRAFDAASTGTTPDEIRSVFVEDVAYRGGLFIAASTRLESNLPVKTLGSANEGLDQLFGDGDLLEVLLS